MLQKFRNNILKVYNLFQTDEFEQHMRKCDLYRNLTIFDIGAHKGQTSLYFNKIFDKSHIYAFEPSPVLFESFQKNTSRHSNIKSYNFGLGEIPTSAYLSNPSSDLCGQVRFENEDSFQKIKLESINNFCSEQNISQIDLLKIDTEGHEISVLKGASELLNSCAIKAIYLECDFNIDDPQHTFFHDIFNYLTERSFAFHGLFEVIHYSRNYGVGYCNALFINREII